MAIVTTKSTAVTAADNKEKVDRRIARARMLTSTGFVNKAAADNNTSVYRFVRIPSSAIVRSITLNSDAAITGGTAYQLAVYDQSSENAGAAIGNLTSFGAAADLSTAGIKVLRPTAADSEKSLWQLLGQTAVDPGKLVDIVLIAGTAGTTAANIQMDVHWTE